MSDYIFPLLAIVALCALWAVFQLWLWRHDSDAEDRSTKCAGCNCEKQDATGIPGHRKSGHS